MRVCESGSMCYQFARKCDFERLSWGGEDLSRYKQCSHLGDKCACLSRKILDRFDTFSDKQRDKECSFMGCQHITSQSK